jgi:acetoin utilization deacetylase AcuC-like enzyme
MKKLVLYYPEGHEAHFEPGHPEGPERIEAIRQALELASWWRAFPHLAPVTLPEGLLASVHSPGYLSALKSACRSGKHLDMDTYTTPETWQLALNAAGGAVAIASAVWHGEAQRGFALTRPPGHHATSRIGMGFCLLNNVAIAAQHLLTAGKDRGSNASRLAIVDLDLHHGNGTQEIFWERNDVFYISTHQSPLYPGTGGLRECGEGAGQGYTANFPLPPGTGDEGFKKVMRGLILPLLDRYQPEMLLVSFGTDAHWRDALGSLNLSADGFGELVHDLVVWSDANCAGKIGLFLEGGYDLQAGKACSLASVAALLGEPWDDPLGQSPRPERSDWKGVLEQAEMIWNIREKLAD